MGIPEKGASAIALIPLNHDLNPDLLFDSAIVVTTIGIPGDSIRSVRGR